MKKRLIPVVVLVLAGVAFVVWKRSQVDADTGRIRFSGNIELTEVDIAFKSPGKLVERTVDEGDAVKKGQLVARLDAVQIERTRGAQQAGIDSAVMQIEQSVTAVQMQKATVDGDNSLRRAEVAQATAVLDQMLAGARPQEVQQAEAAVADARTVHNQARLDWERAQTLYKNDDISTAQRDQSQSRFHSTAAVLKQAEQRLALVREGPRKEEIAAARAQLEKAKAGLKISEATQLEVRRREQELAARRAEVERQRRQMGVTESQLSDASVASPVDGVVLVKAAEVGEVLGAGATVVTIGDVDHPWVRGYVREQDLGRVKLGQTVRVTSDSYPGKRYTGKVTYIASKAEFTPKQIQTKEERVKLVYRIKVEVENPNRELKSNMPVDAEIEL